MIWWAVVFGIVFLLIFAELRSLREILSWLSQTCAHNAETEQKLKTANWDISEYKNSLEELLTICIPRHNDLSEVEKAIVNHAKYVLAKRKEDEI